MVHIQVVICKSVLAVQGIMQISCLLLFLPFYCIWMQFHWGPWCWCFVELGFWCARRELGHKGRQIQEDQILCCSVKGRRTILELLRRWSWSCFKAVFVRGRPWFMSSRIHRLAFRVFSRYLFLGSNRGVLDWDAPSSSFFACYFFPCNYHVLVKLQNVFFCDIF